MGMGIYQERISNLLKEFSDSITCNIDKEQIEQLNLYQSKLAFAWKML